MQDFLVKKKKVKNSILAIIATCGIVIEMTDMAQNTGLAGDLLWIPCFFFWYWIFTRCDKIEKNRNIQIMIFIYSICISCSLVMGIALENMYSPISLSVIMKGILVFFAVYPIVKGFTYWIDSLNIKGHIEKRRVIVYSYLVIVAFWIMAYLAMFPGIYGIDAPTWYNMWNAENRIISSQWSYVVSGLFYYLIKFGEKIGNVNIGFMIFTGLQVIFSLVVIWKIVNFLQRKIGNKAVIIAAAFFSLIPTHVIIAVTSAQDGFFSACFALCSIYIIEACTEEEFWQNKKKIFEMIFSLVVLCIIRNNGLYAIIVMAILSLLFVKKRKKQLYISISVVVVCVLVFQGPIYTMLGVKKGTALREMLSIPLQQIACVYNNADLDEQIKNEIEAYVPKENLENYIPEISDAVKNYSDTDKIKRNPKDFVELYVTVCLKSPRYAIEGFLRQTMGLWYLNKKYPDVNLWHPYLNYKNTDARISWGDDALNIEQNSLFPAYNNLLSYLFAWGDDASGYGGNLQTHFQNIPILANLCRISTYFWVLMYVVMYGIAKKWTDKMVILCLEFGLTCTIFLSPLMCYRYYAPVVFSTPLFLSLVFMNKRNEGGAEVKNKSCG